MRQDIEQPVGPLQETLRSRQPADPVAIAYAVDRQIDGQEQRVDAGFFHARQKVFHEAAVADDVELHPEGLRAGRAHFLQRTAGHGGKDYGYARRFSGTHRLHLAPAAVEARNADGRQRNGQRHVAAEQARGGVDVGDIAQHLLAQGHGLEVLDIAAQRVLVIAAAIDIFEDEAGQALLGRVAESGEIDDLHGIRLPAC